MRLRRGAGARARVGRRPRPPRHVLAGSRLALLTAAAALVVPASAPGASVFVVTGRGWGHGIGLSQYGALGLARHGSGHAEILQHYYRGTVVSPGLPNATVKVLLASARPSVVVSSGAPFSVSGQALAAGAYTVTPQPGGVRLAGPGGTRSVETPATIAPGSAALELAGVAYRGSLLVASSPAGTALSVLNTLPRESYLRGVVPQEMPSSWAAEALEAQAVVARSYSLAVGGHCSWLGAGGPERVLCADVRDQVYGGKSAEQPATNAAVLATAGEVVTHDGRPAETYFFSTSGGRTAAKADEWGGAAVPYLVSVPDPYDALSPHHLWGPGDAELDCSGTSADCVFRAVQVRQLLGLAALPLDLAVTGRNASRRVSALTASTAAGAATFDGAVARRRLGLRSTWFSVGVLSLRASARTVTYGQRVTLAGLTRGGGTRGWRGASLQRRRAGETSWSTIAATLADGIWSSRRAPGIGTDFRVVSGNATGAAVRVNVRTRVAFETPEPPYTRLTGRIGPARAGAAVTLERREVDGTWALVARTKTTTEGGFSFALLRRGTYRATADAGPGYQPGRASASLPPR